MTHDKLTHRVVLMVAMLVWLAGGTARGQATDGADFAAEHALAHAPYPVSYTQITLQKHKRE